MIKTKKMSYFNNIIFFFKPGKTYMKNNQYFAYFKLLSNINRANKHSKT